MKVRSYSVDDLLAAGAQMHGEAINWDRRSSVRYDWTRNKIASAGVITSLLVDHHHDKASPMTPPSPAPSPAPPLRGSGPGPGSLIHDRSRHGSAASDYGSRHRQHLQQLDESGRGQSGSDQTRPLPPGWVQTVIEQNRGVMAASAQLVFNGTMQGGVAFLGLFGLFLMAFQILSIMQEQNQWYPSFIKYSVTESKQLVVDNAFVVRATLETTGEPVVVAPRYASCESKWQGLSLIDYALLAELAYFDQNDPKVPLSEVAKHFFPEKSGPAFEIKVQSLDYNHAQFFEAYSPELNVSVVAIRGTDVARVSDLIEDIKIWLEPIVLKALSLVFPTIRIWPDSTSSVVIEWLHETLQLFGLQQQAQYYRPLVEYVRAIKGRNVVLTGHSLGGGLARIVGALEKATSICFSPPGIAQSYRKFSVGAQALDRALLHEMSVSVIPEHDFVPMIDTQVGLIQLISCSTEGKALQLSCHMLEGTLCDLIKHCGDERGRFTDCAFEYNMSHLLPHLVVHLQSSKVTIFVICTIAMVVVGFVLVALPDLFA